MAIPFWFEDPLILLKQKYIMELIPKNEMSRNQKLNAVMRVVLGLTIIGYAISRRTAILISAFLVGVISIVYWWNGSRYEKEAIKEGLEAMNQARFSTPELELTKPTKDNPMMNIRVNDILDNPTRAPALPSFDPKVEKEINDKTKDFVTEQFNSDPKIRELLFSDLVETIKFDDSMRNFHSMPSTSLPNDQGAFAQFCYGDQPSCKEGDGLACERNAFRQYPTV
jgi:hypothetical protein